MSGKTGIKVFAPASIANFSTGLNIMSVAVEKVGDEITAILSNEITGVEIETISGFKKGLSRDRKMNSASLGGQLLLNHLGDTKTGIKLKIHKKTPLNSGFSSNASSAVAGVFAVNELLENPLNKYELLAFAEKAASVFNYRPFPSQVCSILFGGMILYKNDITEKFQKIYTPHGIHLTLLFPEIQILEKEKIKMIEHSVSISESIQSQGNIATMISSFYTSNFDLFAEALQDNILKEKLKIYYPFFQDIEEVAIKLGAFGCGFAGLGPGVFIASPNSLIAGEIELLLDAIFKKHKTRFSLLHTKINLNGVFHY